MISLTHPISLVPVFRGYSRRNTRGKKKKKKRTKFASAVKRYRMPKTPIDFLTFKVL